MTVDDLYNLIVDLRHEGMGGHKVYLASDEEGNNFNPASMDWSEIVDDDGEVWFLDREDPDFEEPASNLPRGIVLWP